MRIGSEQEETESKRDLRIVANSEKENTLSWKKCRRQQPR